MPQHSPSVSGEQAAASATIRLHFIPIGQAMSGPHTMGMAQAPSDATDCPFEAAVSGLQYVTPSQPHTGSGFGDRPAGGGLGWQVPTPHPGARQ